jgi:tetratricopeptide (TPR) repeat protein
LAAVLAHASATAAPVPRQGPISGRIVAKKQGETAVLRPAPEQRPAEVRQDLKAGDVLRTNAVGTLAIVFADRTQIRVGRNSTLVIKEVRRGAPSSVSLQRGSIWARSPRGASQLSVETPSATAAIRGTEYSIVASDDQTTLTVVEGVVDFFNPQGQIEVREGQSAAARLGQAPTRIFTVTPDSREQMLYYLSLDAALAYLRPAALPQRAARAQVERVRGIDPAVRTAEDWLALAESGAEVEPRAVIAEALARARADDLDAPQRARVQLVEANLAVSDRDFAGAHRLYEQALPLLTGRQKEVARYGVFITATLLDPSGAGGEVPALDENEPISYVGQAFLAAYLGDFDQARALAEAGLRRYPEESALYTVLGGIGLLTGDDKAMEEAARQALAVDPEDPFAIRLQTELELNYRGNPEAAIAKARRGVELAPGDDESWNILAQSLDSWDQGRQAERAIKAGLAERPNSFILRGNYALILLQQQRIAESRKQLALARALDPDNAVVHLAEGFLDLSEGRRDEAIVHGIDASTANPSYSEALLFLAELYYANGDYDLAMQQIDAADRADPNNPIVSFYRAAFAIDSYRADDAIVAAREALRRYRARGGVYALLSESKGSGSYIAEAFRLLDLDEWARYYGDRTYDPFLPAALFDRALSRAANPYLYTRDYLPFDTEAAGGASAISDVFQGIRLDPLSIAGAEKDLHITPQKFIELGVTPSLLVSGGDASFSQSANLNGIMFDPAPLAFSVTLSRDRLEPPPGNNDGRRTRSIQGFFGLKASPYDNVLLNLNHSDQRNDLTGVADQLLDGRLRDRNTSLFAIYAHRFDRENVLSLGGGYVESRQRLQRNDLVQFGDLPIFLDSQFREQNNAKGWLAFANHAIGLGTVDVQAGAEYFSADLKQKLDQLVTLTDFGTVTESLEQVIKLDEYRVYGDARFAPSDSLTLQMQLVLSGIEVDGAQANHFDFSFGAAVVPARNHWLRAAYIRSNNIELPFTMAPTAIVGLREAEAPATAGSQSETIVARWETEWSPHFYTSFEAQHQDFDGLTFPKPSFVDPLDPLDLDLPLGLKSVEVGAARLDRVSASASLWLTGNVGVRAVYSFTDSKVEEGAGAGRAIPFAPRHFARGQVAWTHESRVKLSAGLSYVGPRIIDLEGTRGARAWLGDIQLQWELLDKQVQVNAGLFNVFDEDVPLIPSALNFGRTFAASVDFRF